MLVNGTQLLQEAQKKNYAVGAFNVPNLESVRAVVAAAEALKVPVILQHAEGHKSLIPLAEIGPIMLDYAKRATVPIAVHLDHGETFEACIEAIRLGFTSLMYDASGKNYATNLAETKEIVRIAHSVGVTVEAELGQMFTSPIGGGEGGIAASEQDQIDLADVYTDPKVAKDFVTKTDVDYLAISFGTVHGTYQRTPKLNLPLIKEIQTAVGIPLVMHGGSGVSREDYLVAINNGIRKVNYFTYGNRAGGEGVKKLFNQKGIEPEETFFDEIITAGQNAIEANIKEALEIFRNRG